MEPSDNLVTVMITLKFSALSTQENGEKTFCTWRVWGGRGRGAAGLHAPLKCRLTSRRRSELGVQATSLWRLQGRPACGAVWRMKVLSQLEAVNVVDLCNFLLSDAFFSHTCVSVSING